MRPLGLSSWSLKNELKIFTRKERSRLQEPLQMEQIRMKSQFHSSAATNSACSIAWCDCVKWYQLNQNEISHLNTDRQARALQKFFFSSVPSSADDCRMKLFRSLLYYLLKLPFMKLAGRHMERNKI